MKYLLPLIIVLSPFLCRSQLPTFIESMMSGSEYIIEGKVSDSWSFLGDDGHIYTNYVLVVHKVFMGDIDSQTVNLIVPGGTIGNSSLEVSHEVDLKKDYYGLFFLNRNNYPEDSVSTNLQSFQVYGSQNGFLRYYNESDGWIAYSPTGEIENFPDELYSLIKSRSETEIKIYIPSPFE